jgi:hypothetical protein
VAPASGSLRTDCAPNHVLSGSRVGSRFQAPVLEKNPLKSCGHKASRLVKVRGDEPQIPGSHITGCPYPGPIHGASQSRDPCIHPGANRPRVPHPAGNPCVAWCHTRMLTRTNPSNCVRSAQTYRTIEGRLRHYLNPEKSSIYTNSRKGQ